MARTWDEVGGIALAIVSGEHDESLSDIQAACKQRIRRLFRAGQRIELTGTRNVTLEGAKGVILKTNVKTITVRLDDEREYNVPPSMLKAVA